MCRNEIRQLLLALFASSSNPPNVDQMVDQFISHVDQDGDNLISLREFLGIVRDPVLADIRDKIVRACLKLWLTPQGRWQISSSNSGPQQEIWLRVTR